MKRLNGVVVATITPMDSKGKIDEHYLDDYIEFLITNKVNALYPLGTTGEMIHLDLEERKRFAEAVVRKVQGRISVFIHTGSIRTEDTIELSKHAYNIGADGIGVVTPIYMPVNDREMEEYYSSIADALPSDFPIYMYNIPQFSANDLSPEVAGKIALRYPNVIGIKYSYPNMVRALEYLAINGGSFSVLCGPDSILQAVLALGCDGIVSGVAGVFPELIVASCKCFKMRDFAKAGQIQFVIYKACNILKQGADMAYFKKALLFRGIDVGYIRTPQLDLTKNEAELLKADMDELLHEIKALKLEDILSGEENE